MHIFSKSLLECDPTNQNTQQRKRKQKIKHRKEVKGIFKRRGQLSRHDRWGDAQERDLLTAVSTKTLCYGFFNLEGIWPKFHSWRDQVKFFCPCSAWISWQCSFIPQEKFALTRSWHMGVDSWELRCGSSRAVHTLRRYFSLMPASGPLHHCGELCFLKLTWALSLYFFGMGSCSPSWSYSWLVSTERIIPGHFT